MIGRKKIHFLIEQFFIVAGLIILTATLLVGLYFNKYDEQEKERIICKKYIVCFLNLLFRR